MRPRSVPVVLGAVLALAACGQPAGSSGAPAPSGVGLPAADDALVLRVEQVGGFTVAGAELSRLPSVSVYADGRVLSPAPVAAIYPAPAWPAVQLTRVDDAELADLLQAALDAGVTDTADLGTGGLADATTTVVTVTTAEGTSRREVYALREAQGAPSLTAEQVAARQELAGLVDRLDEVVATSGELWSPTAVAALASTYTADPVVTAEPVAWPGPELPGEPVGAGFGCTVATGDLAAAVVAAAQRATSATPWVDGDATWSVAFRPLLPDEGGCADLTG
ncbi:hypothetical protein TEK04_17045 [Klenkia sp. LSe6-5]|uniref:Uncharacterized protein n=1 Tax=Klenkia sesuvii TaxID=3103137 RepID=A0ABU8DX56_9ACTN